MDQRTSGALLLAIGGVALRLGLTDAALAYVKAGLRPPLVVAGTILLLLGALQISRAFRATVEHAAPAADGTPTEAADHGHDGPRVAWLLALPLLALLLVAPPPLGAFAASRQSDALSKPMRGEAGPLPAPVDGAVELTLGEYSFRALYDTELSLQDKTVRLTGFVTNAEPGDDGAFRLTRFKLNCCAADGQAINVVVKGDQAPPPVETWLEVEGRWLGRSDEEADLITPKPAVIELTSMRQVPEPSQPYEY